MRHANHRAFQDAGQLVQEAFNFSRINVVATADDQVFAAPDDGDVAIVANFANVASLEVAVGGKFLSRFLRHSPVTLKHIRAFDLDAANVASWQAFSIVVLHPHADARQRKANCAAAPFATLVGIGCQHGGFTHAVALQNGVAGARLPIAKSVDQQRRRPGNEQAHIAARIQAQTRLGQQPHIQRGHAHEHRRFRQFFNHFFGIEL